MGVLWIQFKICFFFQVVPTALLAALLKSSVREAKSALKQQPVLRQAVLDTLSGRLAQAH